ncbi:hypothetical protein HPB50_018336 [Hyalomma asiaticum]|uniref:Uncharacterized protein n=1 Tax=Hyalomma asiaticum TaxID=266040 RepID=A0ACB7RJV1_HYAAI|nr:hypothetical protein HPB50_018336 [Hyalomma asiaticum]
MPDNRRTRVHRVSGHGVSGVNWRPTRFAEDVPAAHVCCLCGTIPSSTVLLPCAHLLCEPCRVGSATHGNCLCPLDGEPFEEHDCHVIPMPARKASRLKVQRDLMPTAGTKLGAVNSWATCKLFCGISRKNVTSTSSNVRAVVRMCCTKRLPAHYVSVCVVETASASTEQPAFQDNAPTRDAFSTAVEDLKTALANSYHDQLPALQSLLNELVEHSKNQGEQMLEITRSIADFQRTLKGELAQIIAGMFSLSSLLEGVHSGDRQSDSTRQENLPENAVILEEGLTPESMPWCLEQKLILRKLELLLHATMSSSEDVRQAAQKDRLTPTVFCKPVGPSFCHVMNRTLSSSLRGCEERERVTYLVTVRNASELFNYQGPCRKFAVLTQCHCRDAYFIIYFSSGLRSGRQCLVLSVECGGFLKTSQLVTSDFSVTMLHSEEDKDCPMRKVLSVFPFPGMHFMAQLDALKSGGFLRDDELKFQVAIG